MRKAFLWLVLFVILARGFVAPAHAQFETLEATPASAGGELAINDIQSATEAYYGRVEEYRNAEKRFLLAREDYYQQNTLAALEEANRRAKDVLRARSDVLHSYYRYLRLSLEATNGIELADKEEALAQLRFWEEALIEHREATAPLVSRPQLDGHLRLLNDQKLSLVSAAYSSLSLMKMGNIQTAVDNTILVREYMADQIDQSSLAAAEKEIKLRGLEEVDRLVQAARNNYAKLREDYMLFTRQNNYSEQNYRAFQGNAEYSYLQLRQSLSFLKEISRGVK